MINYDYNRFLDVLPTPRTRVELPVPAEINPAHAVGWAYVNANFLRGADGNPKTYIAAMGPLPSTVGAFWRMVWHTKAHVRSYTHNSYVH